MAKQDKNTKPGFVIKLSTETVKKLTDEEASRHDITEVSNPENVKETLTIISHDKEIKNTDKSSESIKDPRNKQNSIKDDIKESVATNSEPVSDWGDYTPYITFEGDTAIYTDPSSQDKYTWCDKAKSWVAKSKDNSEKDGRVYSYENDVHVYTDTDGSKFFWDVEKKAWLPKIDDDFLAYYQMSYGFVDNTATDSEKIKDKAVRQAEAENKKEAPGTKRKADPEWFDAAEEKNTKVYVSNLPLDLTEEEFVDFMQKCGLVMRDPSTQKMKIKLYSDKEHNCFKGDALCTYIKVESVDLALKLLDGSYLKGNTVKVEKAHFQLKGEYNPALKPKKKKKKELEKQKKMQEKLFDWRPEKALGEKSKHERVVILKNVFHPSDFDKEVQLILDFQQDLREECSKCGEVKKVVIYDRHPDGVAQVTMKEPEQADEVVKLINGRWFGKRKLTAEIWDGRTKYRIAETDSEITTRLKNWDKFLDDNEKADKVEDTKAKNKEEVEQLTTVVEKIGVETIISKSCDNILEDNEITETVKVTKANSIEDGEQQSTSRVVEKKPDKEI